MSDFWMSVGAIFGFGAVGAITWLVLKVRDLQSSLLIAQEAAKDAQITAKTKSISADELNGLVKEFIGPGAPKT